MSTQDPRDQAIERLLRHGAAPGPPSAECLDAETLSAWVDGGLEGRSLQRAEARGIPIYVLRNNTVGQIEQSLLSLRGAGGELDPMTAALQEAEEAIAAVSFEGKSAVELSPQNAYIRRLQHELASRHGVETSSRGREPFRRVLVVAANGRPLREDAWADDLRA